MPRMQMEVAGMVMGVEGRQWCYREGITSFCLAITFLEDALFKPRVHVLSCFSRVRLFATLWTVAHQAPLSMGFSRQE